MSRAPGPERLQKFLAQAGIASRRGAETLISEGRVRVNGRIVTEMGTKVDGYRDRIEVNGKRVVSAKPVYYAVHKPRGMVTTLKDPEGRPTIASIIGKIPERVFPIGRLDFHTSGLLLCTNDGELAEALLRPTGGVPKTYIAKFRGHLENLALQNLRNGVLLDDGYRTKAADVLVDREEDRVTWLKITLYEGKNRQIHRMAEAVGSLVMRLARTSFAGVDSEDLRPGEFREVTREELNEIKKKYLNPFRRAKVLAAEAAAANAGVVGEDGEGEGDEESGFDVEYEDG